MMKNNNLSLIKRSIFSVTIGIFSIALLLSGCQKPAETEAANEPQTTETATVNKPVVVEGAASISATDQEEKSQPITILALGDSLTEGLGVDPEDNYPAQLEAKLKQMGYTNVDVVNSGLSGETSTGLVNRLDWVSQTEPDITILTIGANDAIRGLDVATVEKNIRTAVKHLQDNGSEVILGGMQIYDNLGNDYVKSFSAIYPRIAKDMNLKMIPFFLDGVGGKAELNQADAIHPTKEGYTIIVDNNILPVLKPELERMLQSMQANSLTPVETPTTETAQ
ncbi:MULTISPECIES: arylesterase [unclassified Psychrobacter]|jgi:acyl-CoA thioesterase-1|uniref:arylesterase n=1 Tax=unclassified Psychrobacter TaxID=196806 RepID=UPI0003FC6169|nr:MULTISPECIES: arylesterase [unclassified Psychrobacter]